MGFLILEKGQVLFILKFFANEEGEQLAEVIFK